MHKPTREKVVRAIEEVIDALDELADQVAVVGGAVVSLYADEPTAMDVRPTRDIDLVFEIASQAELQELEKKLNKKGFKHAQDENVICRFVINTILVDVMATKEIGWAPGDKWFELGFKDIIKHKLNDKEINILPFPYFLASKFTAYHDRDEDPRQSKHFEDIVYLLDNRIKWTDDILGSDQIVKQYIVYQLKLIEGNANLQEAIQIHLEPATQMVRFARIMQNIGMVLNEFQ